MPPRHIQLRNGLGESISPRYELLLCHVQRGRQRAVSIIDARRAPGERGNTLVCVERRSEADPTPFLQERRTVARSDAFLVEASGVDCGCEVAQTAPGLET